MRSHFSRSWLLQADGRNCCRTRGVPRLICALLEARSSFSTSGSRRSASSSSPESDSCSCCILEKSLSFRRIMSGVGPLGASLPVNLELEHWRNDPFKPEGWPFRPHAVSLCTPRPRSAARPRHTTLWHTPPRAITRPQRFGTVTKAPSIRQCSNSCKLFHHSRSRLLT